MSPDDDAQQRREDARIAAESRLREAAIKVALDDRVAFWIELGFNVRSEADIARLRSALSAMETLGIEVRDVTGRQRSVRAVEWLYGAYDASVSRNKRLLGWVVTLVSLSTGIATLIKWYLDIKGGP